MSSVHIGAGNPIKRTAIGKNTTGSSTAVGDALVYDFTTLADGIALIQPTTALLMFRAGIAEAVIADDDYIEIVIAGYCKAKVLGHASLAVGSQLIVVNAQSYLAYSSETTYKRLDAMAIAGEAYTTTTAAAAKKVMVFAGDMA